MSLPRGELEAAVLVGVERANGGELAPLAQVLGTMNALMPVALRPDPEQFADCAATLLELELIEWREGQLGLTVTGRRLLRRSGLRNDPRHVINVTRLLEELEPDEWAGDPPPGPSAEDVRQAVADDAAQAAGDFAPLAPRSPTTGSVFPVSAPVADWVPAVPPLESDEPTPEPVGAQFTDSPAHPLLDRLFRRGRAREDRQP